MSYQNPFKDQDLVKFPCVSCSKNSVRDYIFTGVTDVEDFKEKDYVIEIDFSTYLRMNDIEESEDIRVYKCDNCGHHISYFPNSGCRYMP
jgi:predicted RNA-binding Zn-ribbon protein involved in translation (DUF1610 family)